MSRRTQNAEHGTKRSWHHRMARLMFLSQWRPKCSVRACERATAWICEWDQQKGKQTISRNMLYCTDHATAFAKRHGIDIQKCPRVKLADIGTASRDDWAYAEDGRR